MTDYKGYQPHHREVARLDKESNFLASLMPLIALVLIIGVIVSECVDATVKTVENEEQETRRRIYASETYSRPAAYRLASPTEEQMDHLYHVRQVAEVAK